MSPNSKLRFDAFERPVSLADVRRELPGSNQKLRRQALWSGVFILGAILWIVFPLLAGRPGFEQLTSVLAIVAALAVTAVMVIPLITNRELRDLLKVKRFADENGLGFLYDQKDPIRTGMIFNRGSERTIRGGFVVGGGAGRELEIANYRYVTGSGKNRHEVLWGFVRIALTRQLPHMVLDGKSNNFIGSNLPEILAGNQRLRLEGDFNDYFDLYVPAGYERDALYVLTPDVMALLIDEARRYDLEIIGNELFIYASGGFQFGSRPAIEKVLGLAQKMGSEFEAQTDYYADARVGNRQANVVAAPGRTLKKGINWVAVALVAVFLYFMYGDELHLPDWMGMLIIFGMFGFALVVMIREILRNKKLQRREKREE